MASRSPASSPAGAFLNAAMSASKSVSSSSSSSSGGGGGGGSSSSNGNPNSSSSSSSFNIPSPAVPPQKTYRISLSHQHPPRQQHSGDGTTTNNHEHHSASTTPTATPSSSPSSHPPLPLHPHHHQHHPTAEEVQHAEEEAHNAAYAAAAKAKLKPDIPHFKYKHVVGTQEHVQHQSSTDSGVGGGGGISSSPSISSSSSPLVSRIPRSTPLAQPHRAASPLTKPTPAWLSSSAPSSSSSAAAASATSSSKNNASSSSSSNRNGVVVGWRSMFSVFSSDEKNNVNAPAATAGSTFSTLSMASRVALNAKNVTATKHKQKEAWLDVSGWTMGRRLLTIWIALAYGGVYLPVALNRMHATSTALADGLEIPYPKESFVLPSVAESIVYFSSTFEGTWKNCHSVLLGTTVIPENTDIAEGQNIVSSSASTNSTSDNSASNNSTSNNSTSDNNSASNNSTSNNSTSDHNSASNNSTSSATSSPSNISNNQTTTAPSSPLTSSQQQQKSLPFWKIILSYMFSFENIGYSIFQTFFSPHLLFIRQCVLDEFSRLLLSSTSTNKYTPSAPSHVTFFAAASGLRAAILPIVAVAMIAGFYRYKLFVGTSAAGGRTTPRLFATSHAAPFLLSAVLYFSATQGLVPLRKGSSSSSAASYYTEQAIGGSGGWTLVVYRVIARTYTALFVAFLIAVVYALSVKVLYSLRSNNKKKRNSAITDSNNETNSVAQTEEKEQHLESICRTPASVRTLSGFTQLVYILSCVAVIGVSVGLAAGSSPGWSSLVPEMGLFQTPTEGSGLGGVSSFASAAGAIGGTVGSSSTGSILVTGDSTSSIATSSPLTTAPATTTTPFAAASSPTTKTISSFSSSLQIGSFLWFWLLPLEAASMPLCLALVCFILLSSSTSISGGGLSPLQKSSSWAKAFVPAAATAHALLILADAEDTHEAEVVVTASTKFPVRDGIRKIWHHLDATPARGYTSSPSSPSASTSFFFPSTQTLQNIWCLGVFCPRRQRISVVTTVSPFGLHISSTPPPPPTTPATTSTANGVTFSQANIVYPISSSFSGDAAGSSSNSNTTAPIRLRSNLHYRQSTSIGEISTFAELSRACLLSLSEMDQLLLLGLKEEREEVFASHKVAAAIAASIDAKKALKKQLQFNKTTLQSSTTSASNNTAAKISPHVHDDPVAVHRIASILDGGKTLSQQKLTSPVQSVPTSLLLNFEAQIVWFAGTLLGSVVGLHAAEFEIAFYCVLAFVGSAIVRLYSFLIGGESLQDTETSSSSSHQHPSSTASRYSAQARTLAWAVHALGKLGKLTDEHLFEAGAEVLQLAVDLDGTYTAQDAGHTAKNWPPVHHLPVSAPGASGVSSSSTHAAECFCNMPRLSLVSSLGYMQSKGIGGTRGANSHDDSNSDDDDDDDDDEEEEEDSDNKDAILASANVSSHNTLSSSSLKTASPQEKKISSSSSKSNNKNTTNSSNNNINNSAKNKSKLLPLLLSLQDQTLRDEHGMNKLHFASQQGLFDSVRLLLNQGYDIDCLDGDGNSSLHIAIQNGHADVAELLILRGADVHIRNVNGIAPLHLASEKAMTHVAGMLLTKGSSLYREAKANAAHGLDEHLLPAPTTVRHITTASPVKFPNTSPTADSSSNIIETRKQAAFTLGATLVSIETNPPLGTTSHASSFSPSSPPPALRSSMINSTSKFNTTTANRRNSNVSNTSNLRVSFLGAATPNGTTSTTTATGTVATPNDNHHHTKRQDAAAALPTSIPPPTPVPAKGYASTPIASTANLRAPLLSPDGQINTEALSSLVARISAMNSNNTPK